MSLFNEISTKNVLVVGDVMLDTYYNGEVKRISPEAPVPVFKKNGERSVLGGAANVAANLVAAGQKVSIMSVIGDDENGKLIENLFNSHKIDTHLLFKCNRPTTVKIRFMASNNQQVMRLDVEETGPLCDSDYTKILKEFENCISKFDLIVLSDYMKGLLDRNFTQNLIELANRKKIKVIVDVKDPNCAKYSGAYLIKPNTSELNMLTGLPVNSDEQIIFASRQLKTKCNARFVLTTCGARGMIMVGDNDFLYSVNSVGKEVFDVTGAGDTTIAYLAACFANGMDTKRAVDISNYAAGLQVAKVGTSSVYLQEVNDFLQSDNTTFLKKVLSRESLKDFRKSHLTKKIVFTNGCFDILHVGHLRYLKEASALGDLLVVGLNSDSSVKRIKGADRPINCETDRAELLSALSFIDYIVIFDEDTPNEIIKSIQPDVLVKGADYKPEEVIGKDIVEARGGKLVLIDLVEGKSTTGIINRIKN